MSGTRATFPQSAQPEASVAPDSGESLGTFPPAAPSEMTATVETTCDQELIESSLSGSSEAFGALVRRYQHRLYHSLVHMLGSSEDAQDVAQDAFVQAFQKLGTFRGQSGFYSWLYRIAMNTAISSRRKPRQPTVSVEAMREQSGEEPADHRGSAAPAHAMEVAERQQVVRSALAALSEEFRTCVVLKEMDGLSYEEIAGILDCPIGTVRSRIHRGRLELREKLRSFLATGTE